MPSDIAISVRNLTKTFRIFGHPGDRIKQALTLGRVRFHREFTALKDVSFDVKKGETVGIIGRNGSGKSTLLQLICGIIKPTAGTISVSGRVSALLELGAGFNPEFTGRENVYFQGALMGFTKAQMDERFDDVAAFADIGEFIDQPVRMYSSGMYVRLAFATAIHVDPEILVVDEALGVGDIAFQAKCMSAFRQCRESGVTTLFVSHDLNTVKALCNRAVYLNSRRAPLIGNAIDVAEEFWRDMRAAAVKTIEPAPTSSQPLAITEKGFRFNQEFQRRVEGFRQGTGEVRFTDIEFLDEAGAICTEADYGQAVRLRLHIAFNATCDVAVSYYFRDEKQIILAGSTTLLEGYGLVHGSAGDRRIVEFTTMLPFTDGSYNVLAILSFPLIPNRSANFVDFVENACVFRVRERTPVKLWSKLYINNSLSIRDG